ncbi:MAG: cytochrome c [Bryobacterales bacterium]|nr:cytochrome c [Bryobacterales bacterium]
MTRLALALFLCAAAARAHDPITTKLTFTKEIVRLFHKHCANCHRDGGPAPFSLMTYESARPWATAIKEEVLARRMPPWGAVKGFGEFQGDLGLTQEELHLIADWIEGGAPEGDPVFLPQYPNLFMPETDFDYPGPVIARTHKLRRPHPPRRPPRNRPARQHQAHRPSPHRRNPPHHLVLRPPAQVPPPVLAPHPPPPPRRRRTHPHRRRRPPPHHQT